MAGEGEKTIAEIEKQAIEHFNKSIKSSLEREKRMLRHFEWRGNKLPPFSIEPMPYERQRLGGAGMTAQDRMLRKQWVADQVLAPNEPRHIAELTPRNPIRRILGAPWDLAQRAIQPIIGQQYARNARIIVPRLILTTIAFWAMWYNVKYHPSSWETTTGWHMYGNREKILPGDSRWPTPPRKEINDFHDKGFMSRKSLLD